MERWTALDGLRGWAVLLVFCVHAAGNAAGVVYHVDFETAATSSLASVGERLLFWLYRSHHGVFLFFMLSGYLIARLWWPRARYPYATFVWRRTLRIYPAFLLTLVAALAFAHASGTWNLASWPRVIGNLLFLNGVPGSRVVAFNVVTWSLFYELTFYLVLPLLLLSGPGMSAVRWCVPVVGMGAPLVGVWLGADPLVLCWSLLFAGTTLALHEDSVRGWVRRIPAWLVFLLYLAVTTAALFDAAAPWLLVVAFGAAAALVLTKCIEGDNGVAWLLTRRPLVALGRISYSFYLVHWMIVVLVARAVAPRVPAWGLLPSVLTIFAAGFVLSAVAAWICWWLTERPYFAWLGQNGLQSKTVQRSA